LVSPTTWKRKKKAKLKLPSFFLFFILLSAPLLPRGGGDSFRVIAAAPNIEEIIVALGMKDSIVGVGLRSSLPDLPRVAGMKVELERAVSLHPTHLFILPYQETPVLRDLSERFSVSVTTLSFDSFEDIATSIQTVGRLLGRESQGSDLAYQIRNLPVSPSRNVRGLYVIWWKPITVAGSGSYVLDMLERAGISGMDTGSRPYPTLSRESLVTFHPDIVLYADEAGPPPASIRKLLSTHWISVPADLFSRPGPALLKAYPELILHVQRNLQ